MDSTDGAERQQAHTRPLADGMHRDSETILTRPTLARLLGHLAAETRFVAAMLVNRMTNSRISCPYAANLSVFATPTSRSGVPT